MGKGESIDCCMKVDVVTGRPEMTVRDAAALMAARNVGTLPIVDKDANLVGVTTMRDVIHFFLPDFVDLLSNIRYITDYGDLRTPSKENMEIAESMLISDFMAEPVSVEDDCSLIKALIYMDKYQVGDLPVLSQGKLVGIASRVDIGRAFLSSWLTSQSV